MLNLISITFTFHNYVMFYVIITVVTLAMLTTFRALHTSKYSWQVPGHICCIKKVSSKGCSLATQVITSVRPRAQQTVLDTAAWRWLRCMTRTVFPPERTQTHSWRSASVRRVAPVHVRVTWTLDDFLGRSTALHSQAEVKWVGFNVPLNTL